MTNESAELQASINNVLEACGDLLLKVGSEPSRRVPNPGIDTSELNQHILNYQRILDRMELRIRRCVKYVESNPPKKAGDERSASDGGKTIQEPELPNTFDDDVNALDTNGGALADFDLGGLDPLGGLEAGEINFGDLLGDQPADDQINFLDYNL